MAVGEWDRRELCPDGACTGLIGPEGTCKVCGRVAPNWGDERKRGTAVVEGDDEYEDDEEDEAGEPDPITPGVKAETSAWSKRSLCPDGACIGLIGEDGKCKECGKTGVPGAADDDEYEDEEEEYEDEEEEYEDEEDDELAAAADELAGVASNDEVDRADEIAKGANEDGDDNRKLCPDGACIGLIGPDGKCKECGREAEA